MSDSYVEFITGLLSLEQNYCLHIYKQIDGKNQLVEKYSNEAPDIDDIGKKHGGGKYVAIAQAYDPEEKAKKSTTHTFLIADTYNKYLQQNQNQSSDIQNLNTTIGFIKELSTIFQPIIDSMNKAKSEDLQMLATMQEKQTVLILETQKKNFDLIKRLSEKSMIIDDAEYEDQEDQEDQEETNLLETLKPLIEEYLPALLDDSPLTKGILTMIKLSPQFKSIVNNKNDLGSLIDYIDEREGKDNCNKILKKLQIKRV